MTWLTGTCLLIIGIAIVGGVVPLTLRRTERIQHLLIAFAAGVFLGTVFLHLLPEVAAMANGAHAYGHEIEPEHPAGELDHGPHGHTMLWVFVLLGLVVLYLLENLILRRSDTEVIGEERHRTLGWATFLGLSIHAFTAGLGLSAGADIPELRGPLALSVISHKAAEGFSLCVAFLLAGMRRKQILLLIVLFALVTPAGAFGRALVAPEMSGLGLQILTALATGTFLFIAVCDLLPEVFHHRHDTLAKIVLLAAGVGTDDFVRWVVG